MSGRSTRFVTHSKIDLALHTLNGAAGPRLLLLHGLGEASPRLTPPELSPWPGSIHALDFTGHGESSASVGGGYTAELLMADTDAALAKLGPVTLCGRGLGAYIALLAAGGRPSLVRGAILRDGPGMAGGGSSPSGPLILLPAPDDKAPPDPFALLELARDLRPPDYATAFARQAVQLSGAQAESSPSRGRMPGASAEEFPIAVVARQRPEWLEQVVNEPGVRCTTLADALAAYAVDRDDETASG